MVRTTAHDGRSEELREFRSCRMGSRLPGSVNGDKEFDFASGRFEAGACSAFAFATCNSLTPSLMPPPFIAPMPRSRALQKVDSSRL